MLDIQVQSHHWPTSTVTSSTPSSCVEDGGAFGAMFTAALHFFAASQCQLLQTWPPQANLTDGAIFDFVIVGGGTAGVTLAARLSEDLDLNILLLEAGPDPPLDSIVPGFKDSLKVSRFDWNFTSADDKYSSQSLYEGSQLQPRGKMLGGTGSLNDMVYARGFPSDYEEWVAIVGDDWDWVNVLQYFKKTEHLTDERIINDPELMKYHSRGGEIEVAGLNESTFPTDRFLDAFEELGFKRVKDMTNPHGIGTGRFSHNIRAGQRDNPAMSLLNEAVNRGNLHVMKDTLVTKIIVENKVAVGVEAIHGDEKLQLFASKEVIVSAGTYNTAKLLLLSGIGPSDHLRELGIKEIEDLPVGENLHDHVMVLTYLAADNGTCYQPETAYYMEMMEYLYSRTGTFSRTNSMGAYLSLSNSPTIPDFAIYPTCTPISSNFYNGCRKVLGFNHDICITLSNENKDHELLSLAVVLLKPKSRGKVRLSSADPYDDPLIYSGTFVNVEDLDGFPQAMEVAYAMANTSYFLSKRAHVIDLKLPQCEGMEEFELRKCTAKAMATSAWHAVGTAAMGAVVDGTLRVIGVDKLRVVDASVMPTVIRGNTHAPVVMIAEMAADFVKREMFNN